MFSGLAQGTSFLVAALVAALGLLAPSEARAQDKVRVAVLPFNGPPKEAVKAQGAVVKTLRGTYEIVGQGEWDKAAGKLFATSHSADDIAAVAKDLNIKVVVTGAVKKDPDWFLVITVRYGANGQAADKLRYPLRGAKVDAVTVKKIPDELPALVDKAASGPADAVTPEKKDGDADAKAADDADSPLAKKEEKKEEPSGAERPSWAPFFEATLGLMLTGRNFSFDQVQQPSFRSVFVAGLRIDVTGYPLAFLSTREGAAMNALQGVGVGVTYDLIFWPDSVNTCRKDLMPGCMPAGGPYPTSESRLEAGLRWHWNIYAKEMKPELIVHLEYGSHSFSVAKTGPSGAMMDVGPPDVSYSYITVGLGGRFPVLPIVAIVADVHLHIVTDSGPIQTQAEYGPGGNFGFRINAGVEGRPYKGVVLRLNGFYERFGLSFDEPTTNPPAKPTMGGASDQYYGGVLSVGYAY